MITGGCLCGQVRYRIAEEPITGRICWCRVCQYIAAGSGTVNLAFHTAAVAIEGAPSEFRSVADSGNAMVRSFCPNCGTHLFSAAEARPHLVMVRAGTLDDPEIAKPASTIWTKSAPSWAPIHDDLPRVEGQPPPVG